MSSGHTTLGALTCCSRALLGKGIEMHGGGVAFRPGICKPIKNESFGIPIPRHRGSKTGIILLNMGGPETLPGVKSFLQNLFSDRDLFWLPAQKQMAKLITALRLKKVTSQYKILGNGSPVAEWTRIQGNLIARRLDLMSPETAPHRAYCAFRYITPGSREALIEMYNDNVEYAVILSLYPQFSCSTTGSSLNELYREIKNLNIADKMSWHLVDRWPIIPGFIDTYAELTRKALLRLPENERSEALILFSAHSLPLSNIRKGDQYPAEVASSVIAVMEKLGYSNPYCLVWQSKVGRSAWMEPSLIDSITGFTERSVRSVVVVPISFISDHIETLFELDIQCKEHAQKSGLANFIRVDAPNDHSTFINGLAQLVYDSLHGRSGTYSRNRVTCTKCSNSSCSERVQFFSSLKF